MKKTILLIMVLVLPALAGCGDESGNSREGSAPDHGTLGQEVPAPYGWTDYQQRGGE